MSNRLTEKKKAALEKELEVLEKKYAALWKQWSTAQPHERPTLEQQIEQVEQEEHKIKKELEELLRQEELPKRNGNSSYSHWEAHLPKIDFKKAMKRVNQVFTELDDGGAALFLLQNSLMMCGDKCMVRLQELLKEKTSNFKPYPIEILPTQRLDEFGLISHIGEHFNVEISASNFRQKTRSLIDKICASLQPGSATLIELRVSDDLSQREHILSSFLSEFWRPLASALRKPAMASSRVRLVIVIVVSMRLSLDYAARAIVKPGEKLIYNKALELELENWQETEIRNWLYDYSPLPRIQDELTLLAQSIFKSSDNGTPIGVYGALLKALGSP